MKWVRSWRLLAASLLVAESHAATVRGTTRTKDGSNERETALDSGNHHLRTEKNNDERELQLFWRTLIQESVSVPTAEPPTNPPIATPATNAPTLAPVGGVTGSPVAIPGTPAPTTSLVGTPSPTGSGSAVPTTGGVVTPATPAPTAGVVVTPAPTAGTVATPAPTAGTVATPAPTAGTVATPAPTGSGSAVPTSGVIVTPAPVTPSPTAAPITSTPAPITSTPAPIPATPAPTPAPVTAATPAPTKAPTGSPTPPAVSNIQTRLAPFALNGGAEFADQNSYQSQALRRVEEQVNAESFTDAKLVQYYSLYCIYMATNAVSNPITDADPRFAGLSSIPSWLISTGWTANNVDPCDGWYGIDCENGQVTVIALFDNIMTGAFPPEVSLLASDGERSTGAGSLVGIDLFNNEFLFNNADNSWMTFLGSRLEFLFFQATAFAGNLPRLPTGLIEFDCSFTLISGGLTDATFAGLNRLDFALLDGNAYNSSVPDVLGSLPNLRFLYISDAFVEGDLSYMQGMPAIVEHWIDINPGLSGPIFPFIGDLKTLASFSVTQNNIVGTLPTELGNLPEMIQMWLYGNQIGGEIPSELGKLATMSRLQLEGNDFVGSMPAEICANVGFLRPLTTLGADCNDPGFSCACCTCCGIVECNPELFG